MQTTSATWKQLWAAGAPLEARAVIAGTEVPLAAAPVINRAAMQDRLSVGNVASASLALAVRPTGTIPRSAAVAVEARLNDGATASEWLPMGTFYISRRSRDPVTGVTALECYDALLKANVAIDAAVLWTTSQGHPITTNLGEPITFSVAYPRNSVALVDYIALVLGLPLDSRSAIPSFTIADLAPGTTIRDVLGTIAQAGGGNWIVTPAGKLRLVPIVDSAGAGEATEDALDVAGVVGGIGVAPAGTITGVRCTVDGLKTMIGDDTGIVVDVTIAPALAFDMADMLIGQRYQAYTLTGAVCDPAAELGDYVRAGANGEVASVLYGAQITLRPACRSEIAAPEAGEATDEYPYIGGSARTLALAKAYVNQAVDALDGELSQQEIFNRLTGNGAAQGLVLYNGQLYVNASYIKAGTLTLGGANNANGVMQVLDASGNVIGTWNNNGITLNKGTIAGPSVTVGGANNANGVMQVLDALGNIISTMNNAGIDINKGSIKNYSTDGYFYDALDSGALRFYVNMGKLEGGDDRWENIGGVLGGLNGPIPSFDRSHIGLSSFANMNISAAGEIHLWTTGTPNSHIEMNGDVIDITGNLAINGYTCASGTFTTADGKTVTVRKGFITAIT